MNRLPLLSGSHHSFLRFKCPRCSHVAKHAPYADVGFKHYVICPACHASYLMRGSFFGGLMFVLVALAPLLIVTAVFLPAVQRGEIAPLLVIVIAAAVTLPLVLFARTYLARRFLHYEYVGRSAT